MMTYLKNMGGYKHSQLKGKSYEEIQGLYERQQKRIQDFTPMDSDKEAQKPGKRWKRVAGSYATHKSPKKPKVMKSAKDVTKDEAEEYEKEKEELRSSLKIISNDDSKVNYEHLFREFSYYELGIIQLLGKKKAQDMKGFKIILLKDMICCFGEDLRMIFDPDEKDELWMNQLVVEKCRRWNCMNVVEFTLCLGMLEDEEESTMAFELIKFIKSLLEE
ncbi:hypothetical protein Tco_0930061 [Tanacetum coccineum]